MGLGGWAYQSQLSAFAVTQLKLGAKGYGWLLALNGLGACTAALIRRRPGISHRPRSFALHRLRVFIRSSSCFSASCTSRPARLSSFLRRVRHHLIFLHRQQHHSDGIPRSPAGKADGNLGAGFRWEPAGRKLLDGRHRPKGGFRARLAGGRCFLCPRSRRRLFSQPWKSGQSNSSIGCKDDARRHA